MPTTIPELPEPAVVRWPAITTAPNEQTPVRAVRETPPPRARTWCVPTDPPPV